MIFPAEDPRGADPEDRQQRDRNSAWRFTRSVVPALLCDGVRAWSDPGHKIIWRCALHPINRSWRLLHRDAGVANKFALALAFTRHIRSEFGRRHCPGLITDQFHSSSEIVSLDDACDRGA